MPADSRRGTPLRLTIVIDAIESPTAGTERQLLYLLQDLDRSAVVPTLITLRRSRWIDSAALPCPWIDVALPPLRASAFAARLLGLIRAIRVTRADIVQTFFRDGNLYGSIAARLAGVACLVSSRRNVGYWHSRTELALLRMLAHLTDSYLANSHAAASVCADQERVDPERITVIPNALDDAMFDRPSRDAVLERRQRWGFTQSTLVIGSVGNLRRVKRFEVFVEAAASIAARRADVGFVVLGEGPERAALEAAIDRHGLRERFRLPGVEADVVPALHACDCAIMTSESESLSNALMEYMATGRAIVTTPAGGNTELIEDGVTGLLTPIGDDRALASALLALIDDPARRLRLGENGRARSP
ncbi:MAG: glycosyltransferase [Acidobacteria bacterium]|nr:glycosyltransferase [Acidobacteriota bacterium]